MKYSRQKGNWHNRAFAAPMTSRMPRVDGPIPADRGSEVGSCPSRSPARRGEGFLAALGVQEGPGSHPQGAPGPPAASGPEIPAGAVPAPRRAPSPGPDCAPWRATTAGLAQVPGRAATAVPVHRTPVPGRSVRNDSIVSLAAEEAAASAADRAVATLAAWQIQEGPPRAPPRLRSLAFSPAVTPAVERVLLGCGAQGAEIRLCIGRGPLAGAQIHLRQLPGGVEALILTGVEYSRQTLAVAMEEVARRLQRKGYSFRAEARDHSAMTPGRPAAAGTDHGGGPRAPITGERGQTGSAGR
jgi:hypothetical protein